MSVEARSSVVRAASIAAPLADVAPRWAVPSVPARGRVLAAFEQSAYVDLDDRVIAVLWPGLGRGPFAISLAEPAPLASVPAGTAVRAEAGRLQIGDLAVVLTDAPVWDPSLAGAGERVRSCVPSVTRGKEQGVIDTLTRLAPPESVAGLLAPHGRGKQGPHATLITSLERGLAGILAYRDGAITPGAAALIVASDIAGRGPGLTPSGDDVLVGIMHAVTVWPQLAGARGAAELRVLLRDASAPRTTRISRAYLVAAAQEWATEPWHDFVGSLASDDDAIRATVKALLHVGETSGADALTGFCWAWSRLAA